MRKFPPLVEVEPMPWSPWQYLPRFRYAWRPDDKGVHDWRLQQCLQREAMNVPPGTLTEIEHEWRDVPRVPPDEENLPIW